MKAFLISIGRDQTIIFGIGQRQHPSARRNRHHDAAAGSSTFDASCSKSKTTLLPCVEALLIRLMTWRIFRCPRRVRIILLFPQLAWGVFLRLAGFIGPLAGRELGMAWLILRLEPALRDYRGRQQNRSTANHHRYTSHAFLQSLNRSNTART
jgi:hypothetical protein